MIEIDKNHFALTMQGAGMSPQILPGDKIIFERCTPERPGALCAVQIYATPKNPEAIIIAEVTAYPEGIMLVMPGINDNFFAALGEYNILGVAVQLRRTIKPEAAAPAQSAQAAAQQRAGAPRGTPAL